MGDIQDYRTDNLILIMGTNPLPNFVAGHLLMNNNTRLHLVVTNQFDPTNPYLKRDDNIASRLIQKLAPKQKVEEIVINVGDGTKPHLTYEQVLSRVQMYPKESWGINYTGGKKVMAANAYRVVKDALGNNGIGYFSYLNADTMMMSIESSIGIGNEPTVVSSFGKVELRLADLLGLHFQPDQVQDALIKSHQEISNNKDGAITRKISAMPAVTPFQPDFCHAYLNAWLEHLDKMEYWHSRHLDHDLHLVLKEKLEAQSPDCPSIQVGTEEMKNLIRASCKDKKDPFGKLSKDEFNDLKSERAKGVTIPHIGGVWQEKTIEQLASDWNEKTEQVASWLHGRWLEEIVLSAVECIAQKPELHITDFALGVDSKLSYLRQLDREDNWDKNPEKFEGDILILQGYRLFFITVTTDRTKKMNKYKLFEASVRARQIGGDEAKVGLVTLYGCAKGQNQSIEILEKEMAFPLGTTVKAFGPNELKNLPKELEKWLQPPKS